MEKDDNIKGSGNSYDFGARFYDNRIGRWFRPDPIFQPYETPYGYAANNPIIYIDSDGKDNIIYLVLLPSAYAKLSATEIKAIIKTLNDEFEELGLCTEVKLFEKTDELFDKFDSRNLDLTDTYAVLGSVDEIKAEVSNNKELHLDLVDVAEDFEGGVGNPEISANKSVYNYPVWERKNGSGILIDTDAIGEISKMVSTDKATFISYLVLHGLSHNAGENHDTAYALGKDFGLIYNSIDSASGRTTVRGEIDSIDTFEDVLSKYENVEKIGLKYENYVDVVKRRLGNSSSEDNYNENKEKNNQEQIGPRRADGKF